MSTRGREAELRAADFLAAQGLRIVARNWRCRFGEIDLVVRDGATLVFVEVRIAGGTGAVSAGIASSLTGAAFTVRRYAGEDRYGTSIALNRAAFPTAAGAYLATGTAFPDALTGAAAAGAKGRPLYLAPGTCVPVGLRVAVLGQGARSSTLLGGSAVVADAVGRLTAC